VTRRGSKALSVVLAALAWTALIGAGAWAQELAFSATADKTTVEVGQPIKVTLTLSGELADVELPAVEFPEGFSVVARSQSTNFSIRAGTAERAVSLIYVLIPQRAGSFRLGPFTITHRKQAFQTEPIDVTVKKPALPPTLRSPGGRYTL